MRKTIVKYGILILLLFQAGTVFAGGVSSAGALFLLISPGARAGGMGEAQVGVANDAYASYWNPAGLAFLQDTEFAFMHVNWLRNLVPDMYYEFMAFRHHIPMLGTVGGHIIYLNLGDQVRTDEEGNVLGEWVSYMFAVTASYGAYLTDKSAIGLNVKVMHQMLAGAGAGAEKGKGLSTDFAFDIAYLNKRFISRRLDLGVTITNIGPKIAFIDEAQADPMPTNFVLGLNFRAIDTRYNKLNIVLDMSKMLVASYPDMDWDGDGKIGDFDEDGHDSPGGEYNKDGQKEIAHTDPIYKAIFTSWVDDWLLGGDIDLAPTNENSDGVIGGYDWIDTDENGDVDKNIWSDDNENGLMEEGEGEIIYAGYNDDGIEFGDEGWGTYNRWGQKEVGNSKDRTIKNEMDQIIYNTGFEYWYSKYFALRAGFYYDKIGKIGNPTFGVGLRFGGYGFDAGFTLGDPGHPLTNTMRFSLNMEI